jgi:branched-chain amino acid transport system ATP-binding protein
MLLEIKNLVIRYGQAEAIRNISLNVVEGEVVSVIGANGAGKTTVLNAISGLIKPASGEIWFDNKRIDRLPAHDIVKLGITQIPAGRMVFAPMTVLDNIKVGAYLRKDRAGINQDIERMFQHFPILKEKSSQTAGSLSGGQQQMLAVARALMARPRLLLMDEPSIGLSPILVNEVGNIIRDIHQRGLSILLVEQNARLAFNLAKRAYVMSTGKIVIEGDSQQLLNNEEVKKAYLGGSKRAN